jgi:ElaB/YqjD/DUF883 family membrane-anchored ribosome-binding protein
MDNRYDRHNIDEALQVLENAARERSQDLQDLIQSKYANIKDVLSIQPETKNRIREFGERVQENVRHGRDSVNEMMHTGSQRVTDTAGKVNKEVHTHPFQVISGVAVSALLLGFILGTRKHSE